MLDCLGAQDQPREAAMNHTYRVEAIALHNIGVFDDCTIEFPKRPTSAADSQGAGNPLVRGAEWERQEHVAPCDRDDV